jgi:hypothetical protein
MLTTAELRWFYPGTTPAAIQRWFQAEALGPPPPPPASREDIYLGADCLNLGLKLREERLELKLRRRQLGAWQIREACTPPCGGRIAGEAEQWSKWSCEDPTGKTLIPETALAQGPWIPVQKTRLQRKYSIKADQIPIAVPVTTAVDQGCTLEVTALQLQGASWWSLAFEAFGPEAELIDTLHTTVNWAFQAYDGPELRRQSSYAYPTWLTQARS